MESSQSLHPGILLHGTYRIERVLGHGGYGITYLAFDLSLDKQVAIKEFFPNDFCVRDENTSQMHVATESRRDFIARFKEKFLKEAKTIAKLEHPNIVRIYAAFEENGTAYYVMDFIAGRSLAGLVREEGVLPESRAIGYVTKVGEALAYLHARRISHFDVKPANIMVRQADDCPIVIDFGFAKQYDAEGNQTSSTPIGFSHGFAPMEQYRPGGISEFSPTTDLYALAATLYYLLSGVVPPAAIDLVDAPLLFPETIPVRLIAPIAKAMSPARSNRQQSIGEFLYELTAAPEPEPMPDAEQTQFPDADQTQLPDPELVSASPTPTAEATSKPAPAPKSGLATTLAVALGIALLTGGGFYLFNRQASSDANAGGASIGPTALADTLQTKPEEAIAAEQPPFTVKAQPWGATYTVNDVSFDMVDVEGDTFNMGSNDSEAFDREKPVHAETVGSFAIGKTEVTQALWVAVMGSNPSKYIAADKPVEQVTWTDCQNFISKLNRLTGKHFRLPTEAEWEYAARGGANSEGYRYSGGNKLSEVGWYWTGTSGTHPVASKQPNELNLYDMSGNVYEWTADCWSENYNSPRSGTHHVMRGGSWNSQSQFCRSAHRTDGAPEYHNDQLGMRLAL